MIILNMDANAIFLILAFFALMILGPPMIMFFLGIKVRKNNVERAKIYFIIGGIYLIVAGGMCGLLVSG